MSGWNAMSYDAKDTILRVVHHEAEQFFDLADREETWEAPTGAGHWQVRDVVGHLVDTTEAYFVAFDAARNHAEVGAPWGLPGMAERVDSQAQALRSVPREELMERLRTDYAKMREIHEGLSEDDWTDLQVPHYYMGPLPAFFYPAFQLMDYGVHSWDIRQGSGKEHGLSGDAADLLVPFMFEIWRGTVRTEGVTEPFTIGIRVSGRNAGDYRVSVSSEGLAYEQGDIESLPAYIEFDAASLVLCAFGRCNTGTVRGDMDLAERYLQSFFRI
jgi:uncharacterized protein (TIGR03083 family)